MKKVISAGALLATFMLTGCLGSKPTEEDAKQVFMNTLTQEFLRDGTLVVRSFKQVNSEEGEMVGQSFYGIHYVAEMYYPNGLNRACLNLRPSLSYASDRAKCRRVTVKDIGEVTHEKGVLTFWKTAKGWGADDGKIY